MQIERLPPHDIAAEEAVLGSLLIDGEAIDDITMSSDDFYHVPLRELFAGCMILKSRNVKIDQITLSQEMDRQGKLASIGGVSYLSHLTENVPTSLDIAEYAEIVSRLSVARRMIAVGEQIRHIGFSSPPDSSEALNQADQLLLEIRKHGVASPLINPKDRSKALLDRYHELHTNEMVKAIRTGIYDLDKLLGGGFYNGDVVVVGGRASMGKTTFVNSLAHAVGRTGNVLFASAEMNSDAISDRDVAMVVGVPISRIRLGNYDPTLFTNISKAIGDISESNVWIYDDIPMTTDKILQAGIAMQLRFGLKMLIVDYLGMLDDDYGKNQYERVGYMSRKIKQIARKLNVPIILVHQLNRAPDMREDKRPQLSDLRDSGSIEQDADLVLFLYRDSYYLKLQGAETVDMTTEIIVAKNRQGDTGIVRTVYDKVHQAYKPYSQEKELK
jgi:replicative DNA helicase